MEDSHEKIIARTRFVPATPVSCCHAAHIRTERKKENHKRSKEQAKKKKSNGYAKNQGQRQNQGERSSPKKKNREAQIGRLSGRKNYRRRQEGLYVGRMRHGPQYVQLGGMLQPSPKGLERKKGSVPSLVTERRKI
jgi:hypothetical protein